MIYSHDLDLAYVQVVDYGHSMIDEDYYSTTKYRTIDESGSMVQIEVPKEIYYWYLVHPKITDEIPAYIDPDVIESNSSHQNNITDPASGEFWRDFFYNHADESYPLLRDQLANCTTLWPGPSNAISALTNWINGSMSFNSNSERPHQPVRIYRKHMGRCGEYADFSSAAARTALVPCTSILAISEDHTWNEFWEDGWVQWEPVNGYIDIPLVYENGWGKVFGSVFEIKSDGLLTAVTDTYSEGSAAITIYAFDDNNDPIDGAMITLRVGASLLFDNRGFTDNEGKYTFIVGEDRTYYARLDSDIGGDPLNSNEVSLLTTTVDGGEYEFYFSAEGTIPAIAYTEIDPPADDTDDYIMEVNFVAARDIVTGPVVFDDLDNTDFYHRSDGGLLNFSMTDQANYGLYGSSSPFETFNCLTDAADGSVSFDVPAASPWYAFFDIYGQLNNPQHLTGSVTFYSYDHYGGLGTISGLVISSEDSSPIEGATITAGVFETLSAEDGTYTFDVYPQEYEVVCYAAAYGLQTVQNVVVTDSDLIEVDFGLAPLYVEPAFNPTPENEAADISINTDLWWTNGLNTQTIDLYFDTNNPPTTLVLDNVPSLTTFDLEALTYETTYYWQVVGRNMHGSAESDVWSFSTEAFPIVTNGLVAYYPLDSDVIDASGNEFDGTINGVVTFNEGIYGQAADFWGFEGSYVDFGTGPQLTGDQARSFVAWAYTESF
ncbi:MAG: transglutaminase domain-containing protein, partial [Planctomycetes bacterium]|nr:transglutaminase domain-containing protein [Planctomycetota bacterium]